MEFYNETYDDDKKTYDIKKTYRYILSNDEWYHSIFNDVKKKQEEHDDFILKSFRS